MTVYTNKRQHCYCEKAKEKNASSNYTQICHLGPEYKIGMNFTYGVLSSKTLSQASISIGYITGIHLERKLLWSVKGHWPCEQGTGLDKDS